MALNFKSIIEDWPVVKLNAITYFQQGLFAKSILYQNFKYLGEFCLSEQDDVIVKGRRVCNLPLMMEAPKIRFQPNSTNPLGWFEKEWGLLWQIGRHIKPLGPRKSIWFRSKADKWGWSERHYDISVYYFVRNFCSVVLENMFQPVFIISLSLCHPPAVWKGSDNSDKMLRSSNSERSTISFVFHASHRERQKRASLQYVQCLER